MGPEEGVAEGSAGKEVVVAMWKCVVCGGNSFRQRRQCFTCGSARTMASPVVDEIWKENMLPIGVGATEIVERWDEAGKGHHRGGKGAVEARRPEIRTNAAEGTVGNLEDEQRRGEARIREPLQWRRDPVLGKANRWGHQRSEAVGEDVGAGERGGKGPSASQAQSGRAPGPERNQNSTQGGKGKGEEKAAQVDGGRGSGTNAKGNGKGAEKGGESRARSRSGGARGHNSSRAGWQKEGSG